MEDDLAKLEERIKEIRACLDAKRSTEAEFAAKLAQHLKGYIQLDVGGVKYTTSRATLARYPESMLETLVSGRFKVEPMSDGSVFIDRDGALFGILLDAMRNGELNIPPGFADFKALAREVEFYQLPFKVRHARGDGPLRADFSRQQLCGLLVGNPALKDFSGLRFCGLDLGRLRFFGEAVSAAGGGFSVRFVGCDFSGSDLTKIRCMGVNFTQCRFLGARLTSGHFESCVMQECQFGDADLSRATLTQCQLQRASFASADLTDAVCTASNFTGADLTAAILHRTNFTGATMANVNLSDTDTKTANWTQATGVVVNK